MKPHEKYVWDSRPHWKLVRKQISLNLSAKASQRTLLPMLKSFWLQSLHGPWCVRAAAPSTLSWERTDKRLKEEWCVWPFYGTFPGFSWVFFASEFRVSSWDFLDSWLHFVRTRDSNQFHPARLFRDISGIAKSRACKQMHFKSCCLNHRCWGSLGQILRTTDAYDQWF